MVKFENGNIKISVRNLVEFILRNGDIDNRYGGRNEIEAMKLGSRIHRKLQGRMGSCYQSEVPLRFKAEYEEFYIELEGRADGVITQKDAKEGSPGIIIDEIKSMYTEVNAVSEPFLVHKAQAMCYAYMYGAEHGLSLIGIRLTYVNIESEELSDGDIRYFSESYEIDELEKWFRGILDEYYRFARLVYDHTKKRDLSAAGLEFPFPYREGQKDIAVNAYRAVRMGMELFIQAPTGVGKTMSVIFPAVKAMGSGIADKIFYLTAKTITGAVASQAYGILREKGLKIRSIVITAKEKICVMDKTDCRPDRCDRAKGHFDRVNAAMYDIISHEDDITREIILKYAESYQVCPFELCLDLSYFADAVICDYNYVFDPNAKLKRYFADGAKHNYVFLVDEAHNLVDRAREMYSASIRKEDFLEAKRIMDIADRSVSALLLACNRKMLEKKRECGEGLYTCFETIDDFVFLLEKLYSGLEKALEIHREFEGRDMVLELYFAVMNFLSIYEALDDRYRIVGQIGDNGDFYIRLMCINPAGNLRKCMDCAISTILYSATLLPVNYYKYLLSGNTEDYAIYINSPFDKRKRLIALGRDVSTRYTGRTPATYEKIAAYIHMVADKRQGNYMAFFPSYKFMEEVRKKYLEKYPLGENDRLISQSSGMKEEEKENFLREFENWDKGCMLAFCVMGGIFSEGIDLTREKLIGTIVAGTGFPQVCMERELIKEYFDSLGMNGFDYAYRYPGINKVLQAAGRVIRTAEDVGVIVLLDDRFLSSGYSGLFPREWQDRRITDVGGIGGLVEDFWKSTVTIDF